LVAGCASAQQSTLGEKPDGTLKAKKRYLLGQGIGESSKAWCGNTHVTAGTTTGDGSMDFWVPRGAARFHFAGGARFVHGSAMPQEIVIPVITLREIENESAKTRAVEFSLLGSSNKVVTNKQRFEFIQNEPVSERVLARSVLVSLRDGEALISDELSVTFDSTSGLMDERKRSVMLTVKSGSYLREMRKYNFADAIDKWFKLGNNLNQRDTIAVRRTVSGLLKLICPAGDYEKEIVRKCLEYALETRRRVKEQLKKIGGMEFYDVHFSYIDLDDAQERFISVPEQSGGALIPDGRLQPGTLHTISMGTAEMPGTFRLEIQNIAGGGKISASGAAPKEPVRIAFDYFKANSSRVSASIKPGEHDFHLHLVELQNAGAPQALTLGLGVS
jgi:hypothetical protein